MFGRDGSEVYAESTARTDRALVQRFTRGATRIVSQQREGVTSERETEAGVIGDQILAFGRCGKCRP